jgi:hypothetical protein
MLYVYALVEGDPALGEGLAGEPLRAVSIEGLNVVFGAIETAPSILPDQLKSHDAIMRRLAASASAILPARFGTTAADETELARGLAPRATELQRALERVRGCEQMTVRISRFAEAPPAPIAVEEPRDDPAAGPGSRYLTRKLREVQRAKIVPELDPLLRAMAPIVTGERTERHEVPPWIASVFHLIARGRAEEYTARVQAERERLEAAGLRAFVSGPWPPYAFAPEALA